MQTTSLSAKNSKLQFQLNHVNCNSLIGASREAPQNERSGEWLGIMRNQELFLQYQRYKVPTKENFIQSM